jgi:hypothetical protein
MGEIDVKTFLAMSSGPKERVGRELPVARVLESFKYLP